ncbi:hypothetical protein JCM16303_002998 [Sporobolomyces ruberrimus]
MEDTGPVMVLRLASVVLAAALFGLAMTWPVLVLPALSETIAFSSKDRFRFYKSYHRRITPINSLLLPLLTVTLSLSALFAQSVDESALSKPASSLALFDFVKTSRKSIFIIAAILTLAHRPFNFTFLVPRQDLLVEYERSQIARFTGRSLSPVASEDESEYPDSSFDGLNEKSPFNVHKPINTDDVIREMTNFQLGTVALSSLTFLLTIVELACV